MDTNAQLYRDLGATPVINAAGNQTVIGGSRVSPGVQWTNSFIRQGR